MEYTRQQMCGHKDFGAKTRTGNWREDVIRDADNMREYMVKKATGSLATQRQGRAGNTATTEVTLTPQPEDGHLRFGDVVMLQSAHTQGCLAVDVNSMSSGRPSHYKASVSCTATPVLRTAWCIAKARDTAKKFYEAVAESDVVHYGQQVRIVNRMCHDCNLNLSADLPSPHACLRGNKTGQTRGEVTASISGNIETFWRFVPADASIEIESEGNPVAMGDVVILKSVKSNQFLSTEAPRANSFGNEPEVSTFHHRDTLTKHDSMRAGTANLWGVVCAKAGSAFIPHNPYRNNDVVDRVRQKILERGGASGMKGLTRSIRIMDDNGNRRLDRREFKEALRQYGVGLTPAELDSCFEVFDRDGDGNISITEFIRTIRGEMNDVRRNAVLAAFACLDKDGSGVVSFAELHSIYGQNLHRHPEVETGHKTEKQVLLEFVALWDKSGDGIVTLEEFIDYYTNLSASFDNDEHFVFMIHQAWQIGEHEE